MNDSATLSSIRAEVGRLRLYGRDLVLALPLNALAAAYNGTGPEFLPDAIRAKLDDFARPFLPAVMVHDVDFTLSDGTVGSFQAANRRLLINCIICAVAGGVGGWLTKLYGYRMIFIWDFAVTLLSLVFMVMLWFMIKSNEKANGGKYIPPRPWLHGAKLINTND